DIRVDPQIDMPKSMTGSDKTIALAVSDARETKKLGEVGDPNRQMFDIAVNQDPSAAIRTRVAAALGKLGYTVVPYQDGVEPSLKIEVQALKLDSDKRAFDFLTKLHAEVTAHARSGTESFDKTFSVDQSMNTAGPAYKRDTTKLVNSAVSMALSDLLSDQQLLDTLNR
ncbi:MAG TPA: YajG family lipoprotein, partial [Sphingomicrobium sp.]|nr:YajG family lipoprotein [Sphingomicrobium sp.]